MHVRLTDGRIIRADSSLIGGQTFRVSGNPKGLLPTYELGIRSSVPILWFPLLHEATPAQRARYEIGGGGSSLHWEELDEDLSVANLLAG
ncbi:MAG: DUF2442 domain-containing protein, partial [Chloroflexi bacterium]|nr:DUF2442 domain-containing protein [Chloroflexota bacterium]